MKKNRGIKEQLDFDQSGEDHLYELLFKQIEEEKEISINPKFSSQVLKKLQTKRKKEAFKDNILFSMAIAGVLLFSFLTLKVISSFAEGSSMILPKMVLPAMGLAFLIIAFQLIDNRLLKQKRIKQHLGI